MHAYTRIWGLHLLAYLQKKLQTIDVIRPSSDPSPCWSRLSQSLVYGFQDEIRYDCRCVLISSILLDFMSTLAKQTDTKYRLRSYQS